MRIAVCDDDPILRRQAGEYIANYPGSLDIRLDEFSSGKQLLKKFKNTKYDLIFLDIEMPGMDGMAVAKELRRLDEKVFLVFLTSHQEMAVAGYEVAALRFLVKPINRKSIHDCIRLVQSKLKEQILLIHSKEQEEILVPVASILFIEAQNQEVEIVTEQGKLTERQKLNFYETVLKTAEFYRCHRSYLINLLQVKGLQKKTVIMKNQVSIPVSRNKEKALRQELLRAIQKK